MLLVGRNKAPLLNYFPKTFLLIDDGELIDALSLPERRKVLRFDFKRHSFNPLRGMNHLKARDLAEVIYSAYPQGENTLTVRNGKRALARLLKDATRLDRVHGDRKDPSDLEALSALDDVLFSPVLERVLCRPTNFSFDGIILARLNRAELGDFDAFVLGNLLISQYRGVVVISDFGFYGCPSHTSLIRQNRLIAGVNYLDESPLKRHLLLMDRVASHCLPEDAETLAGFAGILKGTNEYNDFIKDSIA